MICELVRQGKKVGVTANSHKVIQNLLLELIKAANEAGLEGLVCMQKVNERPDVTPPGITLTTDNAETLAVLHGGAQVVGGTAWLWSREEYFESVDVLFADEAGQMSLANVLAVSQAAKNVVLLGDPQQLEQPVRGSHPDGAAVSALEHLLAGQKTIPRDMGLFLEKTWRLHPKLCEFTSEVFYEGRLHPRQGLEQQKIEGHPWLGESGLWFLAVAHEGNQNASAEEVECIARLVDSLAQTGVTSIDDKGGSRPLRLDDVLIVAPYNAQVSDLSKRIPNARVGTVDKFQGQQAPVVIYSYDLLARGCAARNGISLQSQPAECRNVARSGVGDCRWQSPSPGTGMPQSAANAIGECALPLRRNGSSRGGVIRVVANGPEIERNVSVKRKPNSRPLVPPLDLVLATLRNTSLSVKQEGDTIIVGHRDFGSRIDVVSPTNRECENIPIRVVLRVKTELPQKFGAIFADDMDEVCGYLSRKSLCTTDGSGLTAEFALRDGAVSAVMGDHDTALWQLAADQPHPEMGGGLFCRLEMPHQAKNAKKLEKLIMRLNRLEWGSQELAPHFGAWCPGRAGMNPAYVSFLPNSLHSIEGIATNVSLWAWYRAGWANAVLASFNIPHGT